MNQLVDVFVNPQNAHFWIFIALLVLIGVLVRAKAPAIVAKALDAAGAKVQAQLDEAKRLRDEAAALLADLKRQREDNERAAAQLLKNAREDAERLRQEAAAKLEEDIARREAMAERKIATAEAQAAADVRAAAVDMAAQAAEAVLAARVGKAKSDPLVDQGLAGLGRFRIDAN